MKYHRGNPRLGLGIRIFGMVERQSNTVILYSVGDRTKDTLITLIKQHDAPTWNYNLFRRMERLL